MTPLLLTFTVLALFVLLFLLGAAFGYEVARSDFFQRADQ